MRGAVFAVPLVVAALSAVGSLSCGGEKEREGTTMNAGAEKPGRPQTVREPAVAGAFYPGGADALAGEVKRLLASAPAQKLDGRIVGLISPHAGYTYSGATAAFGYRALEGRGFTRVIIVAPTHRVGFRGAALPGADAFRTPLGLVPVDAKACAELAGHELYATLPRAHADEHSLEVQLPFLQEALGKFTLIPVIIGQLRGGDAAVVAKPLAKLLDERTVIVASSDFTHYGANFDYLPFTDNIPANLKKLDLGAAALVEKLDVEGFQSYVERTGATICGHDPIAVLCAALPPTARGRLLHYTTSGELTGDWGHCVSYVSMIFTNK